MKARLNRTTRSTAWKSERRIADEVPVGALNGRNAVFDLKHCPIQLVLSHNGRPLVPRRDYVLRQQRIYFKVAPGPHDTVAAVYIWKALRRRC